MTGGRRAFPSPFRKKPCNRTRVAAAGVHFNASPPRSLAPNAPPPQPSHNAYLDAGVPRGGNSRGGRHRRRDGPPSDKHCTSLERLNACRRKTRIRARAVADIVRGRFEHGTWGKRAVIAMGDVKFASGAQGAA